MKVLRCRYCDVISAIKSNLLNDMHNSNNVVGMYVHNRMMISMYCLLGNSVSEGVSGTIVGLHDDGMWTWMWFVLIIHV